MNDTIQTLTDFLQAAEKNRKYPANTVYGIKAALRLFSQELTDEEKESIDTFKAHFEQINQSVFTKNKSKVAAASLETYKRRIQGLIRDYEKYGIDPTKISSWERPIKKATGRKTVETETTKSSNEKHEHDSINEPSLDMGTPMHRLELSLRPSVKAIILLPANLTKEEADKVVGIVQYLASSKSLKKENI